MFLEYTKHPNTLAYALLFYSPPAVPTHGTFLTCHCAAKLFRNTNPHQARQRNRRYQFHRHEASFNSICFNSRVLASMLALSILHRFPIMSQILSGRDEGGWIFNSFGLCCVRPETACKKAG